MAGSNVSIGRRVSAALFLCVLVPGSPAARLRRAKAYRVRTPRRNGNAINVEAAAAFIEPQPKP
jgi:hypothetical protein